MASETPGRPTVIEPEVVSILVSSFQNGMTVRQACWQSGISHEAYYSRVRADAKFADTMARAQASCTLTARQVVLDAINSGDISTAKWWLEKKAPREFGRDPKLEFSDEHAQTGKNPFIGMPDKEFQAFGEELYRSLRISNPDFTVE